MRRSRRKKRAAKPAEKEKAQPKPAAKEPAAKPAEKPKKPAPAIQAKPQPKVPEQWVTLGSADPDAPYRMSVTLTNKGAAIERIELSSPRYCDIDHRNGYLGHLVHGSAGRRERAAGLQVVGPGTPAAKAGLQPGDVIKSFNGKPVSRSCVVREAVGQDEAASEGRRLACCATASRTAKTRRRCAAFRWK